MILLPWESLGTLKMTKAPSFGFGHYSSRSHLQVLPLTLHSLRSSYLSPVYRNIDQIKLGPSSLRSTATLLRRRLNNNNSLGVNLSLRPYSVPFSSLRAPRYDHRRPLPLPYCTPTPPLSPHIQPTPNPVELPSEIPFPLPPHDRSNRPPAKPTPIPTRSLGNAVPRSRTRVRRLQGREMVG